MGRIIWDEAKDKMLLETYATTAEARIALTDGHGVMGDYWKLIAAYMRADGVEGSAEAMRKRYSTITAPKETVTVEPAITEAQAGAHHRVGQYCILRASEAGVFAGIVKSFNPETWECVATQVRRMWKWDSVFVLEELATSGVRKASACKFGVVIPEQTIMGVCQLIPCSDAARKSICGVPNATA